MGRRRTAAAAQEIDTGCRKAPAECGKGRGIQFEDRLLPDQPRQPRIRFRHEGYPCVRFHRGDRPEHGIRPQGAVAADGIGPEALEGDERREGIGAVEGPAVLFIGHGDDGKAIGEFPDGDQCRPRLLDIHHRFDSKAVDAPLEEARRLLPKNRHRLFKGEIAEGLDEMTGGTDIPRHEALRADGTFGESGQFPVRLADVRKTVLSHLDAVRPKVAL